MNSASTSQLPADLSAEQLRAEVFALQQELAETRERMVEFEQTVDAIRRGEVDAVVVTQEESAQIWTLEAADRLHLNLSKQTAHIGTWDWDLATGDVTWSQSLLHSFGVTSGPPSFNQLLELIYPEDRERVRQRIAQVVQGEDEFYEEFRVLRCDSDLRWISARGRVIRGFRRQPLRLVGISLDITERRQAEEELRQADQRKDEFLAMLAHELRNPLAAISNALLINRTPDLPPEERQWVEELLERQTKQLGRMIDDLLDVARITRNKIELRTENLSLAELARRTLATLRSQQLLVAHHQFVSEVPDEPIWVHGDASRLEQVLVNLLTNAFKYTKEEGKVWLKIAREGDEAVITVKDTGIGIDAEMLPRVFDLFAQAKQGLDRSRGGLGIGLTLVRRIVELHGGTVSVTSPGVGLGSEFMVRLPIAAASPEGLEDGADNSPQCKTRRILVVDDNTDAAQTLALLLKASGHETAIAYEGQGALKLMTSFRPEIALVDIGLPGMSGLELASHLREVRPEIYLVAISGYGQTNDLARSKAVGFDKHFTKPVRFEELLRVLDAVSP
jgi:PAS domain S-box-containing protein